MKKYLKNLLMGASWGVTVNMVCLIIEVAINADFLKSISQFDFIKYAVCAAIVGVGFWLPSVIYDNPNIAMPVKVVVHLGIGFSIYLAAAIFAGWINTDYGVLYAVISIAISILFTLLIYMCFYLYYRKEAAVMNTKIKEIEKQIK